MENTPRFSTWAHFGGAWPYKVSWSAIYHACPMYWISAVIIGVLKLAIKAGAFSSIFKKDIGEPPSPLPPPRHPVITPPHPLTISRPHPPPPPTTPTGADAELIKLGLINTICGLCGCSGIHWSFSNTNMAHELGASVYGGGLGMYVTRRCS